MFKDHSRINESLNETSKLSSPLVMQQRLGQHHSSARREKESEGHFVELADQALPGKEFGKQVRKDGLHPVTTRAKANVLSLKQERLNAQAQVIKVSPFSPIIPGKTQDALSREDGHLSLESKLDSRIHTLRLHPSSQDPFGQMHQQQVPHPHNTAIRKDISTRCAIHNTEANNGILNFQCSANMISRQQHELTDKWQRSITDPKLGGTGASSKALLANDKVSLTRQRTKGRKMNYQEIIRSFVVPKQGPERNRRHNLTEKQMSRVIQNSYLPLQPTSPLRQKVETILTEKKRQLARYLEMAKRGGGGQSMGSKMNTKLLQLTPIAAEGKRTNSQLVLRSDGDVVKTRLEGPSAKRLDTDTDRDPSSA